MKPIRKSFNNQSLFPFELVYRAVKKQNNELPEHFHDHYELVYIHEGKGTFFIDHMWYEKRKGDFFLIPGNTIHHSLPDDEEPIVSSAIFFAPYLINALPTEAGYSSLACFDYVKQRKQYKLELSETTKETIESTLSSMDKEWSKRPVGYQSAIWLELCQLLLKLNRLTNTNATTLKQTNSSHFCPSWMLSALRTIDQHPEQELSLEHLAKQACVSTSHFSRVFRQLTTMNVTNYVNAKRIVKAKQLLLETDMNVDSIAEQCGFQTATHFYRVFKQITGVTPRHYVADTMDKER
jgi:AraC-like DNA-binding protein